MHDFPIKAVNSRYIVQVVDPRSEGVKTDSGFILSAIAAKEHAEKQGERKVIVAVPEYIQISKDEAVDPSYKEGQAILFSDYDGVAFVYNGNRYISVKEKDIVGLIK